MRNRPELKGRPLRVILKEPPPPGNTELDQMTHPVLNRVQVRDVDRRAITEFGLPGVVLMENAGRGCAELMVELGIDGPVVVAAGKGNNGGDGLVIARHLDNAGFEVAVLLFADPESLSDDAAVNLRAVEAGGPGVTVIDPGTGDSTLDELISGADWVVDALLGTGTRSTVREPCIAAIEAVNRSGARVLAVDLPSGLDCDTGEVLGHCVQATHTATMVAAKPGFDATGARQYTGEVHVIDIGIPRLLLEDVLQAAGARRP